ncbi:MAG: histidine kinase, partial [Flavobacteriales bacterium]|nr:histidine kinase [Flavobacteriales bacterium]
WMLSGENDELYLYGFETDDLSGYKYRFWLDSIYAQKGKYVAGFALRHSIDVNGDGFEELYFSVDNRFPIYPRRTYRVDVANQAVKRSPVSSAGFQIQYRTMSENGELLFTSGNSCPGNHKDSLDLPYPDTLGYIYALNADLDFLFDPIPFTTYPSGIKNCFVNQNLISFQSHRSLDSITTVQLRTLNGKLLKERSFRSLKFYGRKSENEFILGNAKEMVVIDSLLDVQKRVELNYPIRDLSEVDLNGDGNMEMLALSDDSERCLVYDDELQYATQFLIEAGGSLLHLPRQYAPGKFEFVAFGNQKLIFYRYKENPYYYFRFPYYLGVFLIALLLSSITFKYYRKNIERRFEQEREFNRLQMLSLKNQIDPHFALNTLNSVDWMYKSGQVEKATKYMETYSRLMHQTVASYDELNFCRKFCELEKLRQPDFDFEIQVDDQIDAFEIKVPRQIVFTHVENAIKHGLRPKDGDKYLNIQVQKVNLGIEIAIENNGVPYKKKLSTSGTGKGLEILDQMAGLYTSLTGKEIESRVEPKSDGVGTRATITVET